MTTLWFKLFYRNSKKNWLNSFINIIGLSLGLIGLTIVLSYFNYENSFNSWNPHKEEIYRVIHDVNDGVIWEFSNAVEGATFKEELPEVTDIYLSNGYYDDVLIETNQKKIFLDGLLEGDANFFDFFPFTVLEGSIESFKNAKNNLALSKEQASKLYGQESALGQIITFYDKPYTVAMVYEIPGSSYFSPSIVYQFTEKLEPQWGNFSYTLFCKINKGSNIASLETKMANILRAHRNNTTDKVFLEQLADIRLKGKSKDGGPEGKGNYKLLMIFLSLSILLIFISSVNFVNLSIASAAFRAKEIGIKKTLGLSKKHIYFQLGGEILLQCFISMIIALVAVELILPYFNTFMGLNLDLNEPKILIQVFSITTLVAIIISSIPAIYSANFKSIKVLKGNIARSKKGVLLRHFMLGLQFLISGFFLISMLIILNQVNYMMQKDLGFSGDQIAIVYGHSSASGMYDRYQVAKKELIKHPNIKNVTSNFFIPGNGASNSTNVTYRDKDIIGYSNPIDFGYIETVNIEVLKGRSLQSKFASDTLKNILINEVLAKELGIHEDPIGKKIDIGLSDGVNDGKQLTIIGMVKDYHIRGFDQKIPPMFMMHWNSFSFMKNYNFRKIQFKIDPDNIEDTMAYIENYWKTNIEQDYPFEYEFLNDSFARTYKKYQRQQTLMSIITMIAISIALLGLFALATLTIQQRYKEVAIRKTLGASIYEIMIQLLKDFIKITILASLFLIPITYYFMQQWLNDFVYHIDMPFWPYIITPVILILLVIFIVGIKAYNATKLDLITYLKFE